MPYKGPGVEALERVSKPFVRLFVTKPLRSFCRLAKKDWARVWEEFLLGHRAALDTIQGFLQSYVRNSVQMRIVLDAREYAKVRLVTSTSTVVGVWRLLVAAADFHVMEAKRQAQPERASSLRLLWFHNVEGRLEGPAFKVVLVSDPFFYILVRKRIDAD